mgnify:CR=1 FL=1
MDQEELKWYATEFSKFMQAGDKNKAAGIGEKLLYELKKKLDKEFESFSDKGIEPWEFAEVLGTGMEAFRSFCRGVNRELKCLAVPPVLFLEYIETLLAESNGGKREDLVLYI